MNNLDPIDIDPKPGSIWTRIILYVLLAAIVAVVVIGRLCEG